MIFGHMINILSYLNLETVLVSCLKMFQNSVAANSPGLVLELTSIVQSLVRWGFR